MIFFLGVPPPKKNHVYFSIFICLFHHNLYIFICSAIKSKENRILYLKSGLFTFSYQVFWRWLPQLSSTRWSYKADLIWFSTYLWWSFHLAALSVAEPYFVSNCWMKGNHRPKCRVDYSTIQFSIQRSLCIVYTLGCFLWVCKL